jgi:hypothetical protein
MTRISLAVLLLAAAACGHHKPTDQPKGDAGLPPLIKSVAISLQAQADGDVSHVFLAAMDETGKTLSYPAGDAPGACASIAPDGADLVTLECKAAAATTRIHAIKQGQDVVVLKETVAAGAAPDPMNRDEVQRVTMPVDSKIEAAK